MASQATCPKCLGPFGVPANALGARLKCPHCRAELEWRGDAAGAVAAAAPLPSTYSPPLPSTSPPAPAPAGAMPPGLPARRRASRYNDSPAAAGPLAADYVVHAMYCAQDPNFGREVTEHFQKLIADEVASNSVAVTDDASIYGRRATLADGFVSLAETVGGFMTKGNCALTVTANLSAGENPPVQLTQSATAAQGNQAAMRKLTLNTVGLNLGKQIFPLISPFKRRYTTCKQLGITSLVCGIFGVFPFISFFFGPIAIITGLLAISFNSQRPNKVGVKRSIAALILSVIGLIISMLIIMSMNKR